MFETELEFDLTRYSYLDNEIKKFWTIKNNPGYEFFKEKASLAFLNLGQGEYFEFLAYIDGGYGRDILVDFQTSDFMILNKSAIIDEQGNVKVKIKIQPVNKFAEDIKNL